LLEKNYDCLVIGGGIAGLYCAKILVNSGKKVALIEKETLGGTALRWGALPVKIASDYFKNNSEDEFIPYYRKSLNKLEEKIDLLIQKSNLDLFYGEGEFIDENTFLVGEYLIKASHIVIATGTSPKSTKEFIIDKEKVITYKEAANFNQLKEKIIILGANVEGVELANVLSKLNKEIILVEKKHLILPDDDFDLTYPIERDLVENNVTIMTDSEVIKAYTKDDCVEAILKDGSTIVADKLLVTMMNKPNIPKGVERLNIDFDENGIKVDNNFRTTQENIFAIGDVNGKLCMAHAAINQAIQVAEHIIYSREIHQNYDNLPRAVFASLEIAGVGMNESQIKHDRYKIGICEFKDTWRAVSKLYVEGFVKVIADLNDNIMGIWMVGKNVSEYIGLMDLLFKKKINALDIKRGLIIHPTLNEAVLEAVLNLKEIDKKCTRQ